MTKYTGFAPIVFLSVLALADAGGDAVNERIPANKAQLEAHWQVDCAAARAKLQAAIARRSTQDHCGITVELAREIKLCAFVYQPPGDDSRQQCPDYLGISQLLEQSGNLADCHNLPTSIVNKINCDAARP